MVHFDSPQPQSLEEAEELSGNMGSQGKEDKLMHSILEHDKKTVDEGKLINAALNQSQGGFIPDMMFQQLVNNYSVAKQLYGETLLRLASGYNPEYIQKNIGIPEFQKELQQRISNQYEELKHQGYLSKQGDFTTKAVKLASLVLAMQELDHLDAQGMQGHKPSKERSHYGMSEQARPFKRGDRYRDLDMRKTIRHALKRHRTNLEREDLHTQDKYAKGQSTIIYALDASGSMKGKKIEACKKAGIALAHKAISERDKVGLMVFGSDVRDSIEPTLDFIKIIQAITLAKASKETNFQGTIEKSLELFPSSDTTKHLILITDALATKGDNPEEETLEKVEMAKGAGITISVVGINLDEQGAEFGEKITELSGGRFYIVGNLDELDTIVLQDYDAMHSS